MQVYIHQLMSQKKQSQEMEAQTAERELKLQRKLAQRVLGGLRASRDVGLPSEGEAGADGGPAPAAASSHVPRLPPLPESREQPASPGGGASGGSADPASAQARIAQRNTRRRDQLLSSSVDASPGQGQARRKEEPGGEGGQGQGQGQGLGLEDGSPSGAATVRRSKASASAVFTSLHQQQRAWQEQQAAQLARTYGAGSGTNVGGVGGPISQLTWDR